MMAVTQKLAKETFNIEQNGKSICYKIVPQFSSSLRKDLVLWKKDEKTSGSELMVGFLSLFDGIL